MKGRRSQTVAITQSGSRISITETKAQRVWMSLGASGMLDDEDTLQ